MSLLQVQKLCVHIQTEMGRVAIVNDLSFTLNARETLGIVGESGAGKSLVMLALMGLLPPQAFGSGSVCFEGRELLTLSQKAFNHIRGTEISVIFQDPMTSLNPYLTLAAQMTEVLCVHKGLSYREALNLSIESLEQVRIADAKRRIKEYPHQFSGGMQQRVMIAMALLCHPKLLIADEPTTALDVTVQAQILEVLETLKRERNLSVILITHDMGILARLADRVLVMYAGSAMEYGLTEDIFYRARHPYTQGLLQAVPRLHDPMNEGFKAIPGTAPDLLNEQKGCVFSSRCAYAFPRCFIEKPNLMPYDEAHQKACHLEIIP